MSIKNTSFVLLMENVRINFQKKFDILPNHLPSVFVLDAPAQKYYTDQKYLILFKNVNKEGDNANVKIIPRVNKKRNLSLLTR